MCSLSAEPVNGFASHPTSCAELPLAILSTDPTPKPEFVKKNYEKKEKS
jgi:hypothetical protein